MDSFHYELADAVSEDRLQKALQRHWVQEQLAGRKSQRKQFARILVQGARNLFARVGSILDVAAGALDARSLSTRTAKAVRAYWWVPAGFAVLILLRSIMGG
jgi:hypothetical protein